MVFLILDELPGHVTEASEEAWASCAIRILALEIWSLRSRNQNRGDPEASRPECAECQVDPDSWAFRMPHLSMSLRASGGRKLCLNRTDTRRLSNAGSIPIMFRKSGIGNVPNRESRWRNGGPNFGPEEVNTASWP
jgi:hypothetical protein